MVLKRIRFVGLALGVAGALLVAGMLAYGLLVAERVESLPRHNGIKPTRGT